MRFKDRTSAHSHKWWILGAVSIGSFLGSVDGSIVNVSLPTLMKQLDADFPTIQWVVLAYLLGLTVLMVSTGRLADLMGKKVIYLSGLVVFLLSSILCGLAPDAYWLIGFRFLQSIGAAMLLPLSIAIVTETWPTHQRGMAIGITSGIIAFGIVFGPAIGGFLLEGLSWRWIFFVNLPIGLVALAMVLRFVPALKPTRQHETFDTLGAVVLGVGLLCFTLAVTLGQNMGFTSGLILVLFGLSFISIPIFIKVERQVKFPTVDLTLFDDIQFSLNLFTHWLMSIAIAGIVVLLPFYLELVLDLRLIGVGLMMAAVPLSMAIVQPFSGILSDRFGPRPVIIAGLLMTTFGYWAMSTLQVDGTSWGFSIRLLPAAIGMAIFNSPNNSAIMGAVAQDRLGVASGIISVTRTFGQVIGVALLGTFFAIRLAIYTGPDVGVRDADPSHIVLALRDQFWLVAALVGIGFISALWVRRSEAMERERIASLQTAS